MLKIVSRDLMLSVRELLERGCNVTEIAHRLNLDPNDIQMVINLINNILL
jgi:DNA-binding NarL/FixJ family response regulator